MLLRSCDLEGKALGPQTPNPFNVWTREGCVRQGETPAPVLACSDSPKQGSNKWLNSGEQLSVVSIAAGTQGQGNAG